MLLFLVTTEEGVVRVNEECRGIKVLQRDPNAFSCEDHNDNVKNNINKITKIYRVWGILLLTSWCCCVVLRQHVYVLL